MSDPNPGVGSTGDQVDVVELEPTAEEQNAQGGDPLDEISDVAARAEAKKNRAIMRRNAKKGNEAPAAPVPAAPADASQFLTKEDFEKANERRAIVAAQADPEVKANFTEIQALYVPRRGRATAEDIAEDIKDAVLLFNARNGTQIPADTGVADLTSTPVARAGGAPSAGGGNAPAPKELPGFKAPVPVSEWYPTAKKEGE